MNQSNQEFQYDLAVIGGGSAGYAGARTAAEARLRTVVIEGAKEMGGLCILRGCMPTKALLYAAEVLHLVRQPEPWGVHTKGAGFSWQKVMARKNAMVKEFADHRRRQLEDGRFELVRAKARLENRHRILLDNGKAITARNILISTGSRVALAPLPQLDECGFLNSDTALELTSLPKSMLIVGGGAVAAEFAQFFTRFGVKVTLIQRSPHILHEFDTEVAAVLEQVFRREGIQLFTGTQLLDARRVRRAKEVLFLHEGEKKHVKAEEIFFALGRVPQTARLGLEQVGIAIESGRVITDLQMQTNVPHLYAAGDCTGPYQLTHLAVRQGEVAAHNIAHPENPQSMDYRLLTEVIFTEPQIANVGLTEKRARTRDIPCLAASYPFSDHGKSMILEARDGFVKLLAQPRTGEILGGCCVGPLAGELIHEIIAAMSKRMTVAELAAMPHYHPTLAEIWTYPAEELAARVKTSANPLSRRTHLLGE